MSTCAQEMKAAGRPMGHRATWELQVMVRALHLLPLMNTPEDEARLAEAERELKIRRRNIRKARKVSERKFSQCYPAVR